MDLLSQRHLFSMLCKGLLIKKASPNSNLILTAIHFAGSLLVTIYILKSTFSDPGVLPKNSNRKSNELKVLNEKMIKYYRLKGRMLKMKFCRTCNIFRPFGASHCDECNNCVEKYDHHCPWIGNCVGKSNYRQFFLFLTGYNFLLFFNVFLYFSKFKYALTLNNQGNKWFII